MLIRGANETRQLVSYSDSTQSKLDSCELDSSSSSTRIFFYIKFKKNFLKFYISTLGDDINNIYLFFNS